MSSEATDRRNRSLEILRAEHVPVLETLPVIITEAESRRWATEDVALRALALCLVAVKGEGVEQGVIETLVDKYGLADSFTALEMEFISNSEPSENDRVQFAWRYESYWTLLWALRFVERLDRPDKVCDVKQAVMLFRRYGRDGFIRQASLRPQRVLLNAADLIYRYHWAIVDARLHDREPPAGLDRGVVLERHYALNWLIGLNDQEWDDVTTETHA